MATRESGPAREAATRTGQGLVESLADRSDDSPIWLPCRACDPYACRAGCGRWVPVISYDEYTVRDLGLDCAHDADCPVKAVVV